MIGGKTLKSEYKISYGNVFNFIFSQVILSIYNFFAFVIVAMPITLLYGEVERICRENYILVKVIAILMIGFLLLYALILCAYFFLPKKAIVSNNFIVIKRYMLDFSYVFRGFNDEIFIKDIIECKLYNGKRYLLNRSAPYSVFFFEWDDLIEIKTKSNKVYLVPLKDSEKFLEQIELIRKIGNTSDDSGC